MEEEKVTIEETSTVENNKKNNKGIKIFIYIIIFVIAIVGIILAVNGVDFNFGKEDNYNEVEKDNDYKDDEEQFEDEEQPNDDEDEKIPEDNPEPNPNEEIEQPINIDSYLENISLKPTKEDREKLINSTNCSMCLNEDIYGEMYKEKISDNYKLLYTAYLLWGEAYSLISDTDNHNDLFGDLTISEKILLENARKIFKDVEIPSSFNKNMFYMGTSSLTCSNGRCSFNQSTFGATGVSPFSGYENKLTIEGNNIKVEQLYIEDEYVEYNETNDTYLFDLKIYDKKDGTIIKEIKSYEIDTSKEFDIYAEFSQYYDKVQTYIYKFDENNRLIEVTKVDE